MAEIEIRLRAVIEHVNLAVLERTHRAGVDIEIGVKLLQRDLEAAALEQRTKRRGGEPFT